MTPDLERFVAEGRYRDIGHVVRAGMDLLRQRDAARVASLESVLAAQAEGDRDGYLTGEEVAARVRATIVRKTAASM